MKWCGLQAQVKKMLAHLDGLEKERDLHLAKVRFVYFLGRGWELLLFSLISCLFHSSAISKSSYSIRLMMSLRTAAVDFVYRYI